MTFLQILIDWKDRVGVCFIHYASFCRFIIQEVKALFFIFHWTYWLSSAVEQRIYWQIQMHNRSAIRDTLRFSRLVAVVVLVIFILNGMLVNNRKSESIKCKNYRVFGKKRENSVVEEILCCFFNNKVFCVEPCFRKSQQTRN